MNANERPTSDGHSADDLDWLAVRYVLGETSIEETESFEERLLDDPAAQSATATAFEWTAAVARLAEPVRQEQRNDVAGALRLIGAFATLAASLALAVSAFYRSDEAAVSSRSPNGVETRLALAWAEADEWLDADDDIAANDIAANLFEHDPFANPEFFANPVDELDGASDDGVIAPRWLLEALAGQDEDDTSDGVLPGPTTKES